jgi:hypothetical protein
MKSPSAVSPDKDPGGAQPLHSGSIICSSSCVEDALRLGTSASDFFPVQKGPETVGFEGGDGVSAVCLRFGGIVTFCCPFSRLAAVHGSSLIVSLPRFVRRVERPEYSMREVLSVAAGKTPVLRSAAGPRDSRAAPLFTGDTASPLEGTGFELAVAHGWIEL